MQEAREVGDARQAVAVDLNLRQRLGEPLVLGDDVTVDERAAVGQSGGRDKQARRLDVADPLQVEAEFTSTNHAHSRNTIPSISALTPGACAVPPLPEVCEGPSIL